MQREWNERAREDANFYVAFGRREQDEEEFFATAREMAMALERELKRLPRTSNTRCRRALEIGCGPGRLMRPLSRHFGEIHGVDVSDEMIARARKNLASIPHAHPHHTNGADLAAFADDSFDFVYSYAVFQHIPSREVVFNYLNEARRVLKNGGILRAQINGLDDDVRYYDTWSGVRIAASEIASFALEKDMQLLALEGARTQYMWTTMRKRSAGWWQSPSHGRTRIRHITNANNSEPVAPSRGRFSSITVWVEQLPPDADLNHLEVHIDTLPAQVTYIGPPEGDGLQQVNVLLPELRRTGLLPVELRWHGLPLASQGRVRVMPPAPAVPVVVSLADGIDLLSGARIVTGVVKCTLEEVHRPDQLRVLIDGQPVHDLDSFCTDPRVPRHEVNFTIPPDIEPGARTVELVLGSRQLASLPVEIVRPPVSV